MSAEEKLTAINLEITTHTVNTRIDEANAADLIGNADGIMDAMDTYPTRYLLNEIALRNLPRRHSRVLRAGEHAEEFAPERGSCCPACGNEPKDEDVRKNP